MPKISLYKFLTTFCVFPVTDWPAFIQRLVWRLLAAKMLLTLFNLLKQPLFIVSLVGVLTFAPDTLMWIFIKIGEIELHVMAVVMTTLMPEVFGQGASAYTSWADMWQAGLNILPTDMLEIINGLGVAQILGLVTSTFGAVHMIKIYRKAMMRACLM